MLLPACARVGTEENAGVREVPQIDCYACVLYKLFAMLQAALREEKTSTHFTAGHFDTVYSDKLLTCCRDIVADMQTGSNARFVVKKLPGFRPYWLSFHQEISLRTLALTSSSVTLEVINNKDSVSAWIVRIIVLPSVWCSTR
mmetsp:Transcript_32220/g.47605  ORF Transcript_32220/g.47605 Transcript_32220/m.47605 type:complete len:143 (-) Transcript_32220:1500-1928(-)